MGLRLLRRILVPFAAVVLAACVGTLVIGRTHASSAGAEGSTSSLSLTSDSSPARSAEIQEGYQLFESHCSTCHGAEANGSTGIAPNLQGLGPGVVQLWLSSGWMPLKTPSVQPVRKKPSFTPARIRDIALFIESLHPGGTPFAPKLHLASASLAEGFSLYTVNCAPCHTITGAGDALADGYHAPGLHGVTRTEIWEAVRSGPQNMPQFGPKNITPAQLDDIIKYVTEKIEHPESPGGISLGGVGPVAEGFVGLFVGVGACLVAAYWVGDRTVRDEEGHGEGESDEDGDGESDGDGGEAVTSDDASSAEGDAETR